MARRGRGLEHGLDDDRLRLDDDRLGLDDDVGSTTTGSGSTTTGSGSTATGSGSTATGSDGGGLRFRFGDAARSRAASMIGDGARGVRGRVGAFLRVRGRGGAA